MDVGLLAVLCVVRLITHSEESCRCGVSEYDHEATTMGGDKIDSIFMFCPLFNSVEYYFF